MPHYYDEATELSRLDHLARPVRGRFMGLADASHSLPLNGRLSFYLTYVIFAWEP